MEQDIQQEIIQQPKPKERIIMIILSGVMLFLGLTFGGWAILLYGLVGRADFFRDPYFFLGLILFFGGILFWKRRYK